MGIMMCGDDDNEGRKLWTFSVVHATFQHGGRNTHCDASNPGDTGSCCTISNQCGVGEGDCDSDEQCLDGLTCGTNNCQGQYGWGAEHQHSDCCTTRNNYLCD